MSLRIQVTHLTQMGFLPSDFSSQRCLLYYNVKKLGFPGGSDGKESACNAGDLGSLPMLGRFPWRRAWQPIPVFLPGKSPWTEELGGL